MRKVDLEFTDDVIEFVVLLELLKDFCDIKVCNVLKLDSAASALLNRYSDQLFEKVIKAKAGLNTLLCNNQININKSNKHK